MYSQSAPRAPAGNHQRGDGRAVAHRWPGNIRELKNVVERIVLKAIGTAGSPTDLPPDVVGRERSDMRCRQRPARPRKRAARVERTTCRAHASSSGESFWAAVYPALHVARSDARRSPEDRPDRPRDRPTATTVARSAVQHAADGTTSGSSASCGSTTAICPSSASASLPRESPGLHRQPLTRSARYRAAAGGKH